MSWWSDKEPFDEHDPDYCKNCKGGNSYEECKRCEKWHDGEVYDEGRSNQTERCHRSNRTC